MSIPLGPECERQKQRWAKYRAAAARLNPHAEVSMYSAVSEDADRTGAFLEMTVWVPRSEIEEAPAVVEQIAPIDV